MPDSLSTRLLRAATLVADFAPPLGKWEAGYGANPAANWMQAVRKAGWPTRTEVVALPKSGGVGKGHVADQPIVVVPETWLRAMAALMGIEYRTGEAYRRLVGPAATE